MKLNKSSSYVLIALLRGHVTSAAIANFLNGVELRTIQRSLSRLLELSLVTQSGPSNDPTYAVNYPALLRLSLEEKILVDERRPESIFNHDLIAWLEHLTTDELARNLGSAPIKSVDTMTMRDLEHLTVELSWKSSALEGNTYSLLDTQLLLTEGVKPNNHTEFETQMILNHKDAVAFIVENKELFNDIITFATIEELHRIIVRNLGISTGIRKKLVKITASNYIPPETPVKIREQADIILRIISSHQEPYVRGLLALSLVPYLQIFEDGNKRTGRMLANAILISTVNRGFSLRSVEARDLALAYLAFYEFNSVRALNDILHGELKR